MKTMHRVLFKDAKDMSDIPSGSVDLVVTSPPYPMIAMWDALFFAMNPQILEAMGENRAQKAFELMHETLDPVWHEVFRVLKVGGIACINIGDATRSVGGHFALYANQARILMAMLRIGFSALPAVIWRKQTNAPNKFMGSGMMPPGAYVTLEHETILILRKGPRREFRSDHEKDLRRESAFFWEERNEWFSDIWFDLKGVNQTLTQGSMRQRSGAYPFELPYRLIHMFSIKGDMILDPFLGMGTTMFAAMAAGRHSVGIEIDNHFQQAIFAQTDSMANELNRRIEIRLQRHMDFVQHRLAAGGGFRYKNRPYGFPVKTRQEIDLFINPILTLQGSGENQISVVYSDEPQEAFR